MVLTLTVFALFFLLTVMDQVCLSIACRRARKANVEISTLDEFLNVSESKTWSTISDFAHREANDQLTGLISVHACLFKARIVTFLLFILAGLYSVSKW